jgi:hypothetical protein
MTNPPQLLDDSTSINHPENLVSLAQMWAKKYVSNLNTKEVNPHLSPAETDSLAGREQTAKKLLQSLRFSSAQAWSKTERLLAGQVDRHDIDPSLIDPWVIAEDAHHLYQKTLEAYAQGIPAPKLSTLVGPDIGKVRKKHTTQDPRVIGFVSMQIHYSGQMLLGSLSPLEQSLISFYFKVMDDHLYMPLHRAYEAAANHSATSTALGAVQALLPISTEIAENICHQVTQFHYPEYRSYHGWLTDPAVVTSSVRDVEMFQVYLCTCVLEGNLSAVQEELFPLCLMLYPSLKVGWELVQLLLRLLRAEIKQRLKPAQVLTLMPHVEAVEGMFSTKVLSAIQA